MASEKQTSINDVTIPMRASFVQLLQPRAMEEGGKLLYGLTLAIRKGRKSHRVWLKKFKAQALAHIRENGFKGDLEDLKYPLIGDGDDEKNEKYDSLHKCWTIKFTNQFKPALIDQAHYVLTRDDEIYSGMHCRVSYSFYFYNNKWGKGLTCKVNGVLKTKDDERFGGGPSVAEMFGEPGDTDSEES